MKRASIILLAVLAAVAPSCDGKTTDIVDSAQAAAKEGMEGLEGLKDFELGDLGADAMKSKVSEIAGSLGEQLGSIKDLASATSITEKIGPAIAALEKLKGGLGGMLPDMGSLGGIVDTLKSKFGDKADIMGVLKPMLDKLMALLG